MADTADTWQTWQTHVRHTADIQQHRRIENLDIIEL